MTTKPETPLQQRIRAAYAQTHQYHEMLAIVFPNPSAHRCKSGGGPPVCAMNFGRALRLMGGDRRGMGSQCTVWIPSHTEARP